MLGLRKRQKLTFVDLLEKNRNEINNDPEALKKIEIKIDNKYQKKLKNIEIGRLNNYDTRESNRFR